VSVLLRTSSSGETRIVSLPIPSYRYRVRQDLSFHIVGVSHHTVTVEERERFAFTPSEIASLLEQFHVAGLSGLLLSTCNRCELYWCGPEDGEAWFQDLARARGASSVTQLTRYEGMAAVRHLLLVSAGMDSQILGETEILGQVRRAYDMARAAGTTTREMDLIFSAALTTGRRIRKETLLGRHPASVSSAAVDLAFQLRGDLPAGQVLVLGAGEAAEGVLRALHQRSASMVTLLNRHPERARVLADAWSANSGGLDELESRLKTADLVLVATASTRPVVSGAQLLHAAGLRDGRELIVMDLAVPRNVEPSSRGIPGIRLVDLDDLERLCCPAAGTPSAALAEAEAVIEDELIRLGLSLRGQVAAPRLAELHRLSRELAEQESAWALAQLETLSEAQRQVVRQMAERLVRRVLYPVSRNLRAEFDTSELSPLEEGTTPKS
jgi:glutamyl-tRNA reductase